jgi:hypothetical protein
VVFAVRRRGEGSKIEQASHVANRRRIATVVLAWWWTTPTERTLSRERERQRGREGGRKEREGGEGRERAGRVALHSLVDKRRR